MSAYTNPSVEDFKEYFNRDFPYGDTTDKIMDSDITKAETAAFISINPCLFQSQEMYTLGSLLLSAHYLVMNIRASSQGISGNYPWMTTSKSVGSVSQGMTIPQRILDNPEYAWLSQTNYGTQYLMMILPQLTGQIFMVPGTTRE